MALSKPLRPNSKSALQCLNEAVTLDRLAAAPLNLSFQQIKALPKEDTMAITDQVVPIETRKCAKVIDWNKTVPLVAEVLRTALLQQCITTLTPIDIVCMQVATYLLDQLKYNWDNQGNLNWLLGRDLVEQVNTSLAWHTREAAAIELLTVVAHGEVRTNQNYVNPDQIFLHLIVTVRAITIDISMTALENGLNPGDLYHALQFRFAPPLPPRLTMF